MCLPLQLFKYTCECGHGWYENEADTGDPLRNCPLCWRRVEGPGGIMEEEAENPWWLE